MAFLHWDETYAIGVPEIDEEHCRLFGLVNAFEEEMALQTGRANGLVTLAHLVECARRHFEHEESIMQAMGYHLYDQHRQEHEDLLISIAAVTEWIASDPSAVNTAVLKYLKKWLIDHIVDQDQEMGKFFARRGACAAAAGLSGSHPTP